MILVDSSVWINHLRHPDPALQRLLLARRVIVHPFVIGELACGRIGPRAAMLAELQKLPSAPRASDVEALELIERRSLMARGIGYLDIHLLASTLLAGAAQLWTADRRLEQVASDLAIAWTPTR